ncbi:MAG: septation protein SepH [Actinomycetes bacterium]
MADLRITGVTATHLELQTQDGSKHTLEVTEDLLKALKSRQPSTASQALTPREIQEQLRLGVTIEQMLVSNPSDEDAIRKFGAPIVSELNHVVNLARNVRLNLATDRFADPAHIEFGLVMDDRLRANGADILNWSSRKSEEGQWLVSVDFKITGTAGTATWSFNSKLLLLTPENQTAIQLSNGMTLNMSRNSEVSASSKPDVANSFVHPVNETVESSNTPTSLSVVPEIVEQANTEVLQVHEDTSSKPLLRVMPEEPESIFESSYLDEPLGTAEEFSSEEALVSVDDIVEPVEVVVVENNTAEDIPQSSPPQSTSRWAEVLFGSKHEDEEEF